VRALLGPGKLLVPEVTVLLETDPARAREIARTSIAYNLQLPNYVNNWRRHGFTDGDLASGGSDRLVDALVAWGDEDAILARVREHMDAGADEVAVQVITGAEAGAPELPISQWCRLVAALVPD
jgi:probable F420-dependent oxidoreductase